jgi:hypothetical protein
MNRIVIAAVAVVLSNFAIACAGGSIVDDATVQDVQENQGTTERLLAPPTQDKMGNAIAPELPNADKLGMKDRGNSWNDKSKDPLLDKSVNSATTVAAVTIPGVRGELKNETMDLPGVDVPNIKGEMPSGARDLPTTRLPNTRGEIPSGATNIPSFELPNIHGDLPQEGMDLQPYEVQGVRVHDNRNYMK